MANKQRASKRGVTQKRDKQMVNIARQIFDSRVEKKVYSLTAVGTTVLTTGNVIPITNGIIEGDDINQRSGTAIRLSRFRILYRATAITTSSSIRFILFRDMFNQGTTPTAINLLPNNNWISQYADTREIQQHRFKILNDIMIDLNIAGENVVTKQFDVAAKGMVFYNGSSAVATDNGQGAVFLLVIGNAVSTSYDYTIQTVFTDA